MPQATGNTWEQILEQCLNVSPSNGIDPVIKSTPISSRQNIYKFVSLQVFSGVASLNLMLGHTFYNTSCLAYWYVGSYVHLYMVVA